MTNKGDFNERLLGEYRDVIQALLSTPMDPEPWLSNPLLTAQGRALFAIWTGRASYPGELARVLGVGKSAASDVADALVRAGLVERIPQARPNAPLDRRYVTLRVTRAGHEACSNLAYPYQGVVRLLMRRMTPEEQENLHQTLRTVLRLTRGLASQVQHRDEEDDPPEDGGVQLRIV